MNDYSRKGRVMKAIVITAYGAPEVLNVTRLGQVEIPVLVMWGDSDRIVTPECGQAMATAFRQAEFAIIADAGHLPQLEQPAATFDLLDAYIQKRGS
jgi:pimeloyl-ACP methyl ester carboxylesterase